MLLDQETADLPRDAHLGRWFLASGVVGLVMALLLAVGLHYDSVSSGLVEALWPAAMVQLIDPRTVGAKIAVGLIAYGSNFLIYGLVGAVIGFCTNRLLRSPKRQ
ncbi:MAG: hypothetical protein WA354_00495 [Terracidiphilus sp.]